MFPALPQMGRTAKVLSVEFPRRRAGREAYHGGIDFRWSADAPE